MELWRIQRTNKYDGGTKASTTLFSISIAVLFSKMFRPEANSLPESNNKKVFTSDFEARGSSASTAPEEGSDAAVLRVETALEVTARARPRKRGRTQLHLALSDDVYITAVLTSIQGGQAAMRL